MKLGSANIAGIKFGTLSVLKMYQGTNLVWEPSTGTSYDADTQTFFTAAGITNTTHKSAVNQLVLDLKAAGVWLKMKALYPFVGGNATAHAVNLKTPGTFDLTFFNSPTHDANGVAFNGTSQYADTGLVPSAVLTLNHTQLSYYSGEDYVAGAATGDFGVFEGNTAEMGLYIKRSNGTFSVAYDENSGIIVGDSNLVTNAAGLFASRRSGNVHTILKGATVLASNTSPDSSGHLPSLSLYLNAMHIDGSAVFFSGRPCRFASVSDDLTDEEMGSFNTAVQTYQTTLGRNV